MRLLFYLFSLAVFGQQEQAATGLLEVYCYQHPFSFGIKRRGNCEGETALYSHISGRFHF